MPRLNSLEVLPDSPPFSADLLRSLGLRGIHCGSGQNLRPGWLNTDQSQIKDRQQQRAESGRLTRFEGKMGSLYYLCHDATNTYPVDDGTFEWAYSEHFIEHLEPAAAVAWLADIRRVVEPGGLVRITTPDLRKYVSGYMDPGNRFFAEHWERLRPQLEQLLEGAYPSSADSKQAHHPGGTAPPGPAFMVNQIFHCWGHRWLYDFDELRRVAMLAGFESEAVAEREFNHGRLREVAGLDREARSDESIYVEIERS